MAAEVTSTALGESRPQAQHARAAAGRFTPVMGATPGGGGDGGGSVVLMRRPRPRHRAEDGGEQQETAFASSSSGAAGGRGGGRGGVAPSQPLPLYDQFSIGWNEIFDPAPQEQKPRRLAHSTTAASMRTPRGGGSLPAALLPSGPAAAPAPAVAEGGSAFWASEVLTSKKPPFYLRIPGGKQTSIDRGLKEHLLHYPTSRLRKPSEVMEVELNQLRGILNSEHQEKRRRARRSRQLRRRARVKEGVEDLKELEDKYLGSDHLRPMADPIEQAEARAERELAKDFFAGLGRRRVGVGGAVVQQRR